MAKPEEYVIQTRGLTKNFGVIHAPKISTFT
jgi:hypothetical protein